MLAEMPLFLPPPENERPDLTVVQSASKKPSRLWPTGRTEPAQMLLFA
jgi:hypothetical protein